LTPFDAERRDDCCTGRDDECHEDSSTAGLGYLCDQGHPDHRALSPQL